MKNEKSELDAFMGELAGNSNADPLDSKQDDPFAHFDKEEEQEEIQEEVKDEKPLPFHKDPKIQKYLDKREKEIEERLGEKYGKQETAVKEPVDDEVTDVLIRLIGNDTPEKLSMVKEFRNVLEKGTQRAKQEAIEELQSRQYAEVQADREAEQELENAFENIEETFDVDITSNNAIARKTRQEFVSFVEKIAPKDRNGDIVDYPDMNSAWETFSEMKKATAQPNRAKDLASRSMARSAETTSEPVLKRGGTPFSNSDAFIESLSK